jgi:hypothetical protein
MAKRRKRRAAAPSPSVDYTDPDGNVLTLRQSLSSGTIRKISAVSPGSGVSIDDAWRRRTELLFERLAVRWVIADLPITDQQMLLGRYRMADAGTQVWVRETIGAHVHRYIPELSES